MPRRKRCSTPWVRSDCRRRNSPRSSNGTPKWPIQHVRQTVVPNGPKQARKSARNGPFSTHGPPLTPNRALVTHSAPKKLRRNQGIDKLIWNGKPYRALRLGAQPYCWQGTRSRLRARRTTPPRRTGMHTRKYRRLPATTGRDIKAGPAICIPCACAASPWTTQAMRFERKQNAQKPTWRAHLRRQTMQQRRGVKTGPPEK